MGDPQLSTAPFDRWIAPGDDHSPGPARLCVLVLLLGRSVILGWVGAPNV